MNYNVRIDDAFLRGDHVDGEILQHTDLNELERVAKAAINANYEDIQKLQDGTTTIANSEKFDNATLSKFAVETLQNSDTKVPTSMQTKQYVDTAISAIDLSGYYTSRETDELLDTKVDVVEGKQLSTEDYTTAEKTKLSGIEAGAEVNIIETVKVNGEALSPDGSKAVNVDISGKVDKEAGKGLSTNDYTTADKTKLSGIETGAEVNVQADWNEADNTKDTFIKNKPTVPTKISDLTNDSGYVTNTSYPTNGGETGGVVKINSTNGITLNYDNALNGVSVNYSAYGNRLNQFVIAKGTLEAVITGKGLVSNTDYATNSTGGVIRISSDSYGTNIYNGFLLASPKTYAQYQSAGDTIFIGKGTLENVLNATIGDIQTLLDDLDSGGGVE